MNRNRRSPIIITGMHRSGTALVTRLLEQLGLFVGSELDINSEAAFFQQINQVIFQRVNATWDQPSPVEDLVEAPDLADMTVRCVAADLQSSKLRRYLGWKLYLRYRKLDQLNIPWGWKDPRIVFTLPIWLKIFPDAKVIYLIRNGIDVAASLLKRERDNRERLMQKFEHRFHRKRAGKKLDHAGFHGSVRCLSFEGAFSLWEEYVARAATVLATVPNPVLTIYYEELVRQPESHLDKLARFCDLSSPPERLKQVAGLIDPSRANAFLSDPELPKQSEAVRDNPWMRRHGYGPTRRDAEEQPTRVEDPLSRDPAR